MPQWERILIYILLIVALGLGGYGAYQAGQNADEIAEINAKGRALTVWAQKMSEWAEHVQNDHIHDASNPPPGPPGSHVTPPPPPPEWD